MHVVKLKGVLVLSLAALVVTHSDARKHLTSLIASDQLVSTGHGERVTLEATLTPKAFTSFADASALGMPRADSAGGPIPAGGGVSTGDGAASPWPRYASPVGTTISLESDLETLSQFVKAATFLRVYRTCVPIREAGTFGNPQEDNDHHQSAPTAASSRDDDDDDAQTDPLGGRLSVRADKPAQPPAASSGVSESVDQLLSTYCTDTVFQFDCEDSQCKIKPLGVKFFRSLPAQSSPKARDDPFAASRTDGSRTPADGWRTAAQGGPLEGEALQRVFQQAYVDYISADGKTPTPSVSQSHIQTNLHLSGFNIGNGGGYGGAFVGAHAGGAPEDAAGAADNGIIRTISLDPLTQILSSLTGAFAGLTAPLTQIVNQFFRQTLQPVDFPAPRPFSIFKLVDNPQSGLIDGAGLNDGAGTGLRTSESASEQQQQPLLFKRSPGDFSPDVPTGPRHGPRAETLPTAGQIIPPPSPPGIEPAVAPAGDPVRALGDTLTPPGAAPGGAAPGGAVPGGVPDVAETPSDKPSIEHLLDGVTSHLHEPGRPLVVVSGSVEVGPDGAFHQELRNRTEELIAAQDVRRPEAEGDAEPPQPAPLFKYPHLNLVAPFRANPFDGPNGNQNAMNAALSLLNGDFEAPGVQLLPTLKPAALAVPGGDPIDPVQDWLSRVRLPANVRAATSSVDVLKALSEKSVEVIGNTLAYPSRLANLAVQEVILGPLEQLFQAPGLVPHSELPLQLGGSAVSGTDFVTGKELSSGDFGLATGLPMLAPPPAIAGPITDMMGLYNGPWAPAAAVPAAAPNILQQLTTTDMLPWLPMDAIAAGIPSWVSEALVGSYSSLFTDLVRVAERGLLGLQMVVDVMSDTPIPLTAADISLLANQIAEAFRLSPSGQEADALKSVALTIREIPLPMSNIAFANPNHHSPLKAMFEPLGDLPNLPDHLASAVHQIGNAVIPPPNDAHTSPLNGDANLPRVLHANQFAQNIPKNLPQMIREFQSKFPPRDDSHPAADALAGAAPVAEAAAVGDLGNAAELIVLVPSAPNPDGSIWAGKLDLSPSPFRNLTQQPTTSDSLPWLPLDGIMGNLPGFFVNKLGKAGDWLGKAANVWHKGSVGIDKYASPVVDPIIDNVPGMDPNRNLTLGDSEGLVKNVNPPGQSVTFNPGNIKVSGVKLDGGDDDRNAEGGGVRNSGGTSSAATDYTDRPAPPGQQPNYGGGIQANSGNNYGEYPEQYQGGGGQRREEPYQDEESQDEYGPRRAHRPPADSYGDAGGGRYGAERESRFGGDSAGRFGGNNLRGSYSYDQQQPAPYPSKYSSSRYRNFMRVDGPGEGGSDGGAGGGTLTASVAQLKNPETRRRDLTNLNYDDLIGVERQPSSSIWSRFFRGGESDETPVRSRGDPAGSSSGGWRSWWANRGSGGSAAGMPEQIDSGGYTGGDDGNNSGYPEQERPAPARLTTGGGARYADFPVGKLSSRGRSMSYAQDTSYPSEQLDPFGSYRPGQRPEHDDIEHRERLKWQAAMEAMDRYIRSEAAGRRSQNAQYYDSLEDLERNSPLFRETSGDVGRKAAAGLSSQNSAPQESNNSYGKQSRTRYY